MIRSREDALALLYHHVHDERMHHHCLASEAVLRTLAAETDHDPESWGLAGLLHDIDVEQTDMNRHGLRAREILEDEGLAPEIIAAIVRHNEQASPDPRQTVLDHLLAAGETMTGLITATALVYPDRRLASVKPKSITKRMKEKAFAASVNRDTIRECERAGIELPRFATLCLEAMQRIAPDLGL